MDEPTYAVRLTRTELVLVMSAVRVIQKRSLRDSQRPSAVAKFEEIRRERPNARNANEWRASHLETAYRKMRTVRRQLEQDRQRHTPGNGSKK